MYFVWYLLLGLASGWIANLIVKGSGSGLIVNLVVGLVGGVLGGWLFSFFGLVPAGTLGSLATSVIGAVVLLWMPQPSRTRKSVKPATIMDNMKNGVHADTAEAENTETMDLLAGMLDASTHCGDNDEDDKEPAQAVEETPGEESAPGK